MALFRRTSLKAEEHAQCKALTPWQELVRGSNWIKTQIGSRHKHVGGFWPPNPEETSAGGTPESGPICLKGFPRTEKWGIVCTRVCFLGLHVPRELNHVRNVWLTGNADSHTESTIRALARSALRWRLPRGESVPPREASIIPHSWAWQKQVFPSSDISAEGKWNSLQTSVS